MLCNIYIVECEIDVTLLLVAVYWVTITRFFLTRENYAVQNGDSRSFCAEEIHAVDLVLGMSAPRPLSSLGDLYSWLSRGRRGPVTPRGSPSTSTSRPGRQQPPDTPLCGKSDVLCHAMRPFRYRAWKESALSFPFFERGAIGRSMISSVCQREISLRAVSYLAYVRKYLLYRCWRMSFLFSRTDIFSQLLQR